MEVTTVKQRTRGTKSELTFNHPYKAEYQMQRLRIPYTRDLNGDSSIYLR
jgi:hypothetical protein